MVSSSAGKSDTDLEPLRTEIKGLKEEVRKSNRESRFRFHFGIGLALIAIGIGVQFSTTDLVGKIPNGIFALLFYLIGGVQIIQALASRDDLKGIRKLLMNIGGIILLIGALMISLPFFGEFIPPTWLISIGIIVASFGFILMEVSLIRFHKNAN